MNDPRQHRSPRPPQTHAPAPAADSPRPSVLALVALLCAIAGSVDALAYLLCGQVFVANMTGNTVLFAISLFEHDTHRGLLRGGLILAFFVGIVLSRILVRYAGREATPAQRVGLLVFQAAILTLLAWRAAHAELHLLLAVLALLLGLQNGAFRSFGGLRLNTAFITGDLEQLGEAITTPATPAARAGGFFLSWLGYLGGGLLGAGAAFTFPRSAFLLSAGLTFAAAIHVALIRRSL